MQLDQSKLLKEIKENFPKIRDEINAEQGFLHLKVGVFYSYTQKLINEGEREKVKLAFEIADKFDRLGDAKTQNALVVSYIEYLEFGNTKKNIREWAWEEFPSMLKAEYIEFHGKNGI